MKARRPIASSRQRLAVAPERGAVQEILPGRDVVTQMKSGDHVLQRGEMPEQPDFLERARDPVADALMRAQVRELDPVEGDGAGVRPVDAAHEIEQRRLAGAVRPDDGVDRAGADGERNVAHRVHAAEALVQAFGLQKRGVRLHAQHPGGRRAHRRARPTTRASRSRPSRTASTIPPGMNSTTRVTATP